MRTTICLSAAAILFAAFCYAATDEQNSGKSAAGDQPAAKSNGSKSKTQGRPTESNNSKENGSPTQDNEKKQDKNGAKDQANENEDKNEDKLSPDLKEIVEGAAKFVKAYSEGDGKAVAEQFTEDAEYVDQEGNTFRGRKEIEETLTKFFKDNPGTKLDLSVESVRQVAPGVMIEDGTSVVNRPSRSPERARYTAVHVKVDGKWLVASARDHAIKGERMHAEQVKQLEWLAGDWIDEDNDSIVAFSCQAVDDGNFLLRDFLVTVAGQKVMSGSQRTGWDPVAGKLRAWTFDSEGGFFEGTWHRDGETWVLTSHGTTPDGQSAAATNLFTRVNNHTMTWQAVDQEVDGVRVDDSEVFTLVRRAPELQND